jgi:hypothetical protein
MPLDEVGLKAIIEGYSQFNSQVTQMAVSMGNVDKSLAKIATTSAATASKQDMVSQSTKKLADNYGGVTAKAISFNQISMVANQVMDVASKVYDATAKKAMDYGVQVRGLAMYTGMTTEETSKLIQVSDDLKVEFGTLEMAAKFMFKNGLQPSVETLAQLSDKYLAISDPLQKAEFLTKQFGRAGIDMAEAMNRGGAAIRAMGDAVEPALILTKEQTQAAEDLRAAQDSLNDSVLALSVSLGTELVPALADTTEAIIPMIEFMGNGVSAGIEFMSIGKEVGKAFNKMGIEMAKSGAGWKDYSETALRNAPRLLLLSALFGKTSVNLDILTKAEYDQITALSKIIPYTDSWVTTLGMNKTELERVAIATADAEERANTFALSNQFLGESAMEVALRLADESRATQNSKDASDAAKQAADRLSGSFGELTKQMFYNKAAATMDAEGQLWLARAMGLLNEDTYKILGNIDALTKKYDMNKNGVIDAAEATDAYKQELMLLKAQMDLIQNKNVSVGVDVDVRTNMPDWLIKYLTPGGGWTGGGGGTGDSGGGGGSGWTDPKTGIWYPKKPAGMAGGGLVYQGMDYPVGERGTEWFRPQSNGIIIPNNVVRNYSNSIANKSTVNKNYNLSVITNQSQSAVTSSFGIMRLIG